MRKNLNKNVEMRDKILGYYCDLDKPRPEGPRKGYDIYHFEEVPVGVLTALRDANFLDPEERQNSAPSIAEFIKFMEDHGALFAAHGYAVSVNREDYRVSIEGLQALGVMTPKDREDFIEFAKDADEFDWKTGYCWWD